MYVKWALEKYGKKLASKWEKQNKGVKNGMQSSNRG